MKPSHRIRVLGKEITVKSAASPAEVREVETLVNRKLAEAQASMPVGDPQIPVIIALLNLAESCISLTREIEDMRRHERDTASRLSERIDSALL